MRKNQLGRVLILIIVFTILLSVNGMAQGLLLTQAEVDELYANVTSVTGVAYKEFPEIEVVDKSMLLLLLFAETNFLQVDSLDELNHYYPMMQICGKYSWLTKNIYLVEEDLVTAQNLWNTDAKTVQKLVLIHEMVHALDDQYYDLEHLYAQASSRDQIMSVGALIEGHAMYVAKQVYEHMGFDKDCFEKLWASAAEGVNIVAEQYLAGLRFVSYVLDEGNLSEELLFAKPPLTAHYILNPEWYLQKTPIEFTDLDATFGKEFWNSLPWNFRYGNSVTSDKLTFYLTFQLLEADERLIEGFLTGWSCTLHEITPTQVEIQIPTIDQITYENGYLSVTILQLTTPEFAEQYQSFFKEYNAKQWNEMKEEGQEEEISTPQVEALYPHSYRNSLTSDGANVYATYFLDVLSSQYLVEVLSMNLEMTEQDLLRVIAEIERRLLLSSTESL